MARRSSPLDMPMEPDQILPRNGWEIALNYLGEKSFSPHFVTDLSHAPRWLLQGNDLDEMQPAGVPMAPGPGKVIVEGGIILTRISPDECTIMALGDAVPRFEGPSYTDVSDASACFAVVGPHCMEILSKLCAVDLDRPGGTVPRAARAPVEDVTCLIIRLLGKNDIPGIIISGARGYGHFLLKVFLDAGKEFALSAAGWNRFREWFSVS